MDEFTLLRQIRPDVAEATSEAVAQAKARLMTHIEQEPQDRAERLRYSGSRNKRRPHRVLALAGIAASLAAVMIYAPWGGQPTPASAAGLLSEARSRSAPHPRSPRVSTSR